ncbi:hypothetical protein AYI68_g6124 [Smittium mucronatum]|uniref:Uncharacterized protein n=1 Tax=Smittium mucronatum TaxID=133383 RepID=A0A1R0GSF2_9FUNG|nr:hypothetical protein AYI68_g6124 [Smittium mucronatum]
MLYWTNPYFCPPFEPDIPGNGDGVSGTAGIISISAVAPTGNYGNTKPQKRKISTVEQQTLVPHGMDNQRRVLQEKFLSFTAIEIIVSSQRAFKRRYRYHYTHQHFLDWNLSNKQSAAIQASHIVNYLAHIFKKKELSANTVKSCKSVILGLVADPKTKENPPVSRNF